MLRSSRVLIDLNEHTSLWNYRGKSVVVHMEATTEVAAHLDGTRVDVQSLLGHLVKDQLHDHTGRGLLEELAQVDCLVDEHKLGISIVDFGQSTDLRAWRH